MDESTKKAFELAQDTSKQIITLATAIVALTLTFFKDFTSGAPGFSRVLMAIAWFVFLISIIAGVSHLLALTGSLAGDDPSVMTGSARLFARVEQISFLIALTMAVVAGAFA